MYDIVLKIADSSEARWETVRQYKANTIASDSEDENKIFKAESRAVRKRKNALMTKIPWPASSTVTRGAFAHGAMALNSTSPRPSLQYPANMPFFILSYSARPRLFRASTGPTTWPEGCFACGDLPHSPKMSILLGRNKTTKTSAPSIASSPNREMKNLKISIVLVKMNLPLITTNKSKIRLILWLKADWDKILLFGGL